MKSGLLLRCNGDDCITKMSSASIPTAARPIVFFDINIGETPAGRIKFELFRFVMRFRALGVADSSLFDSDVVPKSVCLSLNMDASQAERCAETGQPKTLGSSVLENTGAFTSDP